MMIKIIKLSSPLQTKTERKKMREQKINCMLDSFHVFILPDLLPMLLGIALLALRKGRLGHYRCHVAFLCSVAFLPWEGAVLY